MNMHYEYLTTFLVVLVDLQLIVNWLTSDKHIIGDLNGYKTDTTFVNVAKVGN